MFDIKIFTQVLLSQLLQTSSTDGSDYNGIAVPLQFSFVNQRECVQIDILDDDDVEFSEDFLLHLADPPPFAAYEIVLGTTIVEIEDDDGECYNQYTNAYHWLLLCTHHAYCC